MGASKERASYHVKWASDTTYVWTAEGWSPLKGECVERYQFQTRKVARQINFEYIECFYNRVRRHLTLNYVSPMTYEQQMR